MSGLTGPACGLVQQCILYTQVKSGRNVHPSEINRLTQISSAAELFLFQQHSSKLEPPLYFEFIMIIVAQKY